MSKQDFGDCRSARIADLNISAEDFLNEYDDERTAHNPPAHGPGLAAEDEKGPVS